MSEKTCLTDKTFSQMAEAKSAIVVWKKMGIFDLACCFRDANCRVWIGTTGQTQPGDQVQALAVNSTATQSAFDPLPADHEIAAAAKSVNDTLTNNVLPNLLVISKISI
jgi:hypothetical protein